MDDIQYEVRITALRPAPFSPARIQAAFADLFSLTPAEAERRLSTLPLSVRGKLSLEQARKYQRVLMRAGMACELRVQEPLPAPGAPASAAPAGVGEAPCD